MLFFDFPQYYADNTVECYDKRGYMLKKLFLCAKKTFLVFGFFFDSLSLCHPLGMCTLPCFHNVMFPTIGYIH